jgi:UDP-N-acetylmuramate: L-alanyl-gamma-D-glutamyl-meso-diaminopimelate ligase
MHIHILGICGTFMGGLARIGIELGHRITGSDANVYPPMSTHLETLGIELAQGFEPSHLEPAPDLVIVGNALSRGNAAVEHILNEGIPYTSGPAWLAESVLKGRHVLAVAGTHGKTTTASLLAWMLDYAGSAPGFLIGGIAENFGASARLGGGGLFVIEADEYDTAFFDKRSKFVHYRPRTLILNNLEFDHADIFPDLNAIKRQFHHLIRTVPGSGRIIWHCSEPALEEVLDMGCWSARETFGLAENADWQVQFSCADGAHYRLRSSAGTSLALESPLFGQHNALNTAAAVVAAAAVEVPFEVSAEALHSFRNVKRRLERLACVDGVTVYDDFAHHPTAITATVQALRQHVGTSRIVAVLEPRSNTMRMGVHRDKLAASLKNADRTLFYAPEDLDWDIAACTAAMGPARAVFHTVDAILGDLKNNSVSGDHVLIMSNGGFQNIHLRLIEVLKGRHAPAG